MCKDTVSYPAVWSYVTNMREFEPVLSTLTTAGGKATWDARHIRALRIHLGLTQDEFSRLLGTRQQTVSEWEIGKHRPRGMSLALFDQIASASGFEQYMDSTLLLNDWRSR